jgi:hypothetical protein
MNKVMKMFTREDVTNIEDNENSNYNIPIQQYFKQPTLVDLTTSDFEYFSSFLTPCET